MRTGKRRPRRRLVTALGRGLAGLTLALVAAAGVQISGLPNGALQAMAQIPGSSSASAIVTRPAAMASLCVSRIGDVMAIGVDATGSTSGCTQGSALIQFRPLTATTAADIGASAGISGTFNSPNSSVALCIDSSGDATAAALSLSTQQATCGQGAALVQVGPASMNVNAAASASEGVTVAPQSLTANAALCVSGSGQVSVADATLGACAPGTTQISVGPASATAGLSAGGSSSAATPSTAMLCVDGSGNVTAAGASADGATSTCTQGSAGIQIGPA